MATIVKTHSVRDHFTERAPSVKATYDAILKAAKMFGPVKQEAKKTSIHLVRRTAFAGIATRKSALILTLKSDSDQDSKRVARREKTSARRWHLEVKLVSAEAVDSELIGWLRRAYELSA